MLLREEEGKLGKVEDAVVVRGGEQAVVQPGQLRAIRRRVPAKQGKGAPHARPRGEKWQA